ncbi:MAG: hypothetical protein KJO07_13750, partial [Deltaproteobacteria bacterium]|nr:hypothetical protein [Deltaproteobacteria bacterium]
MLKRHRKSKLRKRLPASVQPLLEAASQRPTDLARAVALIVDALDNDRTDSAQLQESLELLAEAGPDRESRNLYVASLRALANHRLEAAFDFGAALGHLYPDKRAMKSLVQYHQRAGNYGRALGLLDLLENDAWAKQTRHTLEDKYQQARRRASKGLTTYLGYRNLSADQPRSVLLYGDMNLNVIDGSSIWLASVAQALTGLGFGVHLILREDIERREVIEPLLAHPEIELFEPWAFGQPSLSEGRAAQAIDELDGLWGGYRAVVVRGLSICTELAKRKTLWKRVFPYLTDFYRHRSDHGGAIDIENSTRELFADLRHLAGGFFAQTPAISEL